MTKKNIDVKKAFNMEPEEIVNYFKSKGLKTSYSWRDVWEEAHAKAFTVAKMTDIDLLKDTHDLLAKSIKEGWSEGHFTSEAKDLFAKKGWTGRKEMTNPETGKKEEVELGTPRRIRTIFKNNINSAYAAGRYKQQLEDVDIAPYFQYMCILDEATRPAHRAMHGKVFRYDDPFWSMFYPPNGWGCRCFVRSLSDKEVKKQGVKIEESGKNLRTVNTGEKTPTGSYKFTSKGREYNLKTDAGWSTNIGAHAWNLDVLAYNKIEKLPQNLKDKFISDMASNPHNKAVVVNYIEKSMKKDYKNTPQEITLTWFTSQIIKALKANGKEPATPVVAMKLGKTTHTRRSTKIEKGQALTPEQTKNIWTYINTADEVYLRKNNGKIDRVIYIKMLKEKDIADGRNCILIPINIESKTVNYLSTAERVNYKDALSDAKTFIKVRN